MPRAKKIVAVEVEEAEIVVEQMTTALAEIKKEYGLKLPDNKVEVYIETYIPFFKQLLDLEEEINALLLMEPNEEAAKIAKELRSKYQKIRTASAAQKKNDKADILVEGKFLDAIDNRIDEGAKLKEAKCKEIETHLEKLENDRKEAIRKERVALLESVDYGDTDFLDLSGMTDEAFTRLFEKQKKAKSDADFKATADAQAEKDAEVLRARTRERVSLLNAVGLVYDEQAKSYSNESYEVTLSFVEVEADDEKFKETYEVLLAYFNKKKADKDEELRIEQEKATRIRNRINAVTKLGLVLNTANLTYEGFGQSFTVSDVEGMEPQDFKDNLDLKKEKVDAEKKKIKDAQAEKDLELENARKETSRLQKVKDDKLAEEQALLIAPDKDKFKAFYLKLKDLEKQIPNFSTDKGRSAGNVMVNGFKTLIESAKKEAAKLV